MEKESETSGAYTARPFRFPARPPENGRPKTDAPRTGGGEAAMDAFYHAARQLPGGAAGPMLRIAQSEAAFVTEIRLRSGRPAALSTPSGARFVAPDGRLSRAPGPDALFIDHALLQTCFQAVCGYSVHSFSESIANGFVPMPGGHRAGVCGTAYTDSDGVFTVKNITSLNVRIARTALCACDARLKPLLCAARVGLVIAGEPGSGKTTLLRAVVAQLSRLGRKTAVVDERCEIAPVGPSGFCSTPPVHCDVLSGYPKQTGMQHALRALAPEVLVCDEVGAVEEIDAIAQAANAGVGLVVTMHAPGPAALRRRPQFAALLQTGAVSEVAFLRGRTAPGVVSEVVHVEADV